MSVKTLNISLRRLLFLFAILIFGLYPLSPGIIAQDSKGRLEQKPDPKANRRNGIILLGQIKKILKDRYYDPTFHGIDINEKFRAAEEEINNEDRKWQINRTIAQVLLDLNDSHTTYFPPQKLYDPDYGISLMMMGGACYALNVEKKSDAETKGIMPGDEILTINDLDPVRDSLWVIQYIIYALDPQDTLNLKVRKADKSIQNVTIQTKFISPDESAKRSKELKDAEQRKPYTCSELSTDLIACKLRTFDTDTGVIDKMMKEVGTHKKMILDLRGNGGGIIDTEEHLLGYFFNHDVKIGTAVTRTKTTDRIAKSRKDRAFTGDLSVLIDSRSASASEIFSRAIQIEKRGTIVGDISAGAVMESYRFPISSDAVDPYLKFTVAMMSVTVADMIMSDGGRLEGKGVIPDLPAFPNRIALTHRTDPVLAYAAQKTGTIIDPAKAGDLHFLIPKAVDEIVADDKEKTKANNH